MLPVHIYLGISYDNHTLYKDIKLIGHILDKASLDHKTSNLDLFQH